MNPVEIVQRHARQRVRWAVGQALPASVIRRSAKRGDPHGRVFVASDQPDIGPVLDVATELRATGPVVRGKFAHVALTQETVKEVLTGADFVTGSFVPKDGLMERLWSWADNPRRLGPLEPPSLLVTEPPSHTRYRKLVTRVFTVKAVAQLRERAELISAALLDDLAAAGPGADPVVDLIPTYCAQLPVTLIAEILGVPEKDRHLILELGSGAAPSLDLGLPFAEFKQVEAALASFDTWLGDHLEHLRRHPGGDLMSQLVAAEEDGVGLSDDELKATAGLVLAAGFETTVNLLGNGIALLHDHPDQLARLRTEPDLWSNAVDEMLRLDPPVLLTGRSCVRDTEVGGQPVRRGTPVVTLLAVANRDPEVFTDPDDFDVARPNARDHMSFSAGRHFCLGAALARMEGEVGLRTLFERYPDLALAAGAQRRTTRILRGYDTLPARLGPPRGELHPQPEA